MTLDGKIATYTGSSKWITETKARQHAHQFRSQVDAVLIGGRTAQMDHPHLTARPSSSSRLPGQTTPQDRCLHQRYPPAR